MKFIYAYEGTKITYETTEIVLPEILAAFADFLRGCGYVFNGELIIYEDEEISNEN